MEPLIDYRDQAFINFRDFDFDDSFNHGWRWVDLKRFRLPAKSVAGEALLGALISDYHFADDYAGGGVHPDGGVHGPYRTSCITPDAYERMDRAAVIGVIDRWARQYGGLPSPLADALEVQVYEPIRNATTVYRLKNIGADAFHEWGGVHGQFNEFVVIDHEAAALTLIVAADD